MSYEDGEINERMFNLLGGGSAVMNVVMFTALGEIALENVAYGAIVGLFAGVGSYLFLPWMLRRSAAQNESSDGLSPSEPAARRDDNSQRGVYGLGLEFGGFAMLALGFTQTDPDPVIGLAVAVAVALAVSVVGTVLLNR